MSTTPTFDTPQPKQRRRPRRVILTALVAVLVLVLVAVTALYTWPVAGDELRRSEALSMTFTESQAVADQAVAADLADPAVRPDCRTMLLSHQAPAAKSVLMLHGYTACPAQLRGLAQHYFDLGYNVYVPRAPRHGLTDRGAHAAVTAESLVAYASAAWNVADALGAESGVVGMSGGAVLATWLAEYRADSVQRLLVLSPFYQPAAAQAPRAVLQPMKVLYGFRLLPDRFNDAGYSYSALAQYLRIAATFRPPPGKPALLSVGAVVSPNDTFIDRPLAFSLPAGLAEDTAAEVTLRSLPSGLGLQHDIITPDRLGAAAARLYDLYQRTYVASAA